MRILNWKSLTIFITVHNKIFKDGAKGIKSLPQTL